MSPNLKFHTPANPQTCNEQTHESNGIFLDELWRLGHCLEARPLPFATVLRNPWQGLSLTLSGPVWVALVDPQRRMHSWKCIRRPSTLPVAQGTGGSLFPSVRATRSDTVSVRLGNVKLGLNSEKRKPTSYP